MKRIFTPVFAFLYLTLGTQIVAQSEQQEQRSEYLKKAFTQRCVNRYGFYPQQAKLIITDDVPPTKIAGTFLEGFDNNGNPLYKVIIAEEFALNEPLNEVLAILLHEAAHAGKGHLLIDKTSPLIDRMQEREADIDGVLNDDNTVNQDIVTGGLNNLAKKDAARQASLDDYHPTPENRTAYWQDLTKKTTPITPEEKQHMIACGKEKVGPACEQAIKTWLEAQRKSNRA